MSFDKLFRGIAIGKSFTGRAMGYFGFVNLFLMLLTFKKVYEIQIPSIIIVCVGMVVILFVGFIDYKYVLKYELAHGNRKNNIKKDLEEIKDILKNGREHN